MIKVVKNNSMVLPKKTKIKRDFARSLEFINERYIEEYDSDTLFYDIFHFENKVILNGPPLLNLEKIIRESDVFLDDVKVPQEDIILNNAKGNRTQESYVITNSKHSKIRIVNNYFDISSNIGVNFIDELSNANICCTMSKNNDLKWIKKWIQYYNYVHGIDTFIICDNNSDAYSVDDLISYLHCDELENVRIYITTLNFKYGPQGGIWHNEIPVPWDSNFLQESFFQNIRYKYISNANLLINADIDELLYCGGKSITDVYDEHKCDAIVQNGKWIEAYSPFISTSVDFENFIFQKIYYSNGGNKWSIRPYKLDINSILLSTHSIGGISFKDLSSELTHYHYKAISTNWKYEREIVNKYDYSLGINFDTLNMYSSFPFNFKDELKQYKKINLSELVKVKFKNRKKVQLSGFYIYDDRIFVINFKTDKLDGRIEFSFNSSFLEVFLIVPTEYIYETQNILSFESVPSMLTYHKIHVNKHCIKDYANFIEFVKKEVEFLQRNIISKIGKNI